MTIFKIISIIFNFFLKKRKKNFDSEVIEKFENKEVVDVTVVFNIWKRPHLEEQLVSIINQSVVPKELWIIHYEDHIEIANIIDKYKNALPYINVLRSEKNLKYFGRFSLAINCTTKFVWLIDDDIIPGRKWLENCTQKCEELNSIIACTGRIIPKNNFQPEKFSLRGSFKHYVGVPKGVKTVNYCEKDTRVDYGCNSYFFQREWLSAYWSVWPATFQTGEDIHLSAACKELLGVNTVVLEQTDEDNNGNLYTPYGSDEVATWKQGNFLSEREKVFRYHILEKGWKPIEWDHLETESGSI